MQEWHILDQVWQQQYTYFSNNRTQLQTEKPDTFGLKYQEIAARGRNKRWRDSHPAHKYQKKYRESHREYVKRNVEQQRLRNKKRQKESGSMIVKTDTFV